MNTTYYEDVRVPVSMRVGEENAGWRLITTQLNHERVMLGPAGRARRVVRPRARMGRPTRGVLDEPDVRRALAEVRATWRINELLNWQVALDRGDEVDVADASATKVFSSERAQRAFRLLEEVVGRHGDGADPATGELLHWLDVQAKRSLVLTFGGGVNEVQRELIAQFGLGLPRVPDERHPSSMPSGSAAGGPRRAPARDPVNQPMINNWTEALGDENPAYSQGIAPPAMIQVWTMPGLHGGRATTTRSA